MFRNSQVPVHKDAACLSQSSSLQLDDDALDNDATFLYSPTAMSLIPSLLIKETLICFLSIVAAARLKPKP
jgi:hypothetical protein